MRKWRAPADPALLLLWGLRAVLAIQAARLLLALVTPQGPLGDWRPMVPTLPNPAERLAILSSANVQTGAAAASADLPSDLKLFGVRTGGGGVPGGAIIGRADGQQVSVLVGEVVAPGILLVAVGADFAEVERGGARQRLYLDPEKSPETMTVPQTAAASGTAPAVAAPIVLTPRQQGAAVNGALVAAGTNPALLQASGLQPGDVILAVNGAAITSSADIAQLQSQAAGAARLSLSVERAGKRLTLTLNPIGNR